MQGSSFKARGKGALSLLRSAWSGKSAAGAKPQAAGVRLGAIDREKLLQIVRLGCPQVTAAKYVGLTGEQLENVLQGDDELSRDVLRAEAEAEVRHMGNVHKASHDEKNWRTSVWWLEHRGLGAPEAVEASDEYPEAVLAALEKFAELIVAEIPDVMRRQSLLTKLLHIALESVEPPVVIDAQPHGEGDEPPLGRELGAERQAAGELDRPAILAGRPARMAGLCSGEERDDVTAQE
jgi:hypothetical protein